MDIVIIANFCRDFSKTDNGRFMYLAKELSKEYDVEIITSSFSHSKKKQKEPLAIEWPFKITFLKEPGYKKNVSFRRFYSHCKWGIEVKKYLASRKKPDVVYCAVPSLTGPLQAAKYCEKNNVRFIIDIQDLWPEAFKLAFNVPVISDIVFYPFNKCADGIYKRADIICGVSQTYVDRALKVNKKVSTGHVVYLGTSLETFDENVRNNPIVKEDTSEIWIGYCGTLGASYNLEIILEALKLVQDQGVKNYRLIVLGDGEKRQKYEEYAKENDLNCLFLGRLPYDKMCGWLATCDIAVNPIMPNAAGSIINKHADYVAASLPVINTQQCSEYINLVKHYQMGINCLKEEPGVVAEPIRLLLENSSIRKEMSINARRCGEEKFNRANTYLELIDVFLNSGGSK